MESLPIQAEASSYRLRPAHFPVKSVVSYMNTSCLHMVAFFLKEAKARLDSPVK